MSEAYKTNEACLVCGKAKLNPVTLFKKDYLVKCVNCGFVFCNRIPTREELIEEYSKYGRNDYLSPITILRYNELLDNIEKYRKTNRLIDVGCGIGYFLEIAKQRGWEVFGTEYTDNAVEICRKKGINMQQGVLDSMNYETGYFDVITSFEVMEHINNPNSEVENFSKILRQGGLLYITTPNFNGFSRHIAKADWNIVHYPEHLSYYTPKTISYLMKLHGFKTKKILTTGISITRIKTSMKLSDQKYISPTSDDEQIRNMFEKNNFMGFIKKSINGVLSTIGKGDSMKAFFEKVN
jgi:2-polyprenyl-3-methyl-5-hydroxy-6-metoxy-1,4-benzoquinol methylase